MLTSDSSRTDLSTKAILDRAVFQPKRQVIILFSGGRAALSPYYLEAVAYAKKMVLPDSGCDKRILAKT